MPDVTSMKLSIPNPTREMLPASAPATTATRPSRVFHPIVKYSKDFPRCDTACRFAIVPTTRGYQGTDWHRSTEGRSRRNFLGKFASHRRGRYTFSWSGQMKNIAKIGILILVVVMGGAPLMACMLPSSMMTAQEKACCRRMAHRCGDHTMPSSHSCCKTVSSPERVAVTRSSFDQVPQVHFAYQVQPTVALSDMTHGAFIRSSASGHSPPESPPSSSDILRI